MNHMKAVSPRLSWKVSLGWFRRSLLTTLNSLDTSCSSLGGEHSLSRARDAHCHEWDNGWKLSRANKSNYPQSPWKIRNRQFMQVFLFLLLTLHLLSLQLQSLLKLSFVIIKQQCKQLSQKPLLKLLEMIS